VHRRERDTLARRRQILAGLPRRAVIAPGVGRAKARREKGAQSGGAASTVTRRFAIGSLLASLLFVHQAQAARLTLACAGTVTSVIVSSNKLVPDDVLTNNLADFSVIVDLEKQVVSGFEIGENHVHDDIPITAADANSVTFMEERKGANEMRITGSVDRITGRILAEETRYLTDISRPMHKKWNLRCRPTKPLF
jgi:hypothetical protein